MDFRGNASHLRISIGFLDGVYIWKNIWMLKMNKNIHKIYEIDDSEALKRAVEGNNRQLCIKCHKNPAIKDYLCAKCFSELNKGGKQ